MDNDNDEDSIDLSEYIGLFYENRYLIIGITLLFLLVGICVAVLSTPIYRADTLLQIDQGKRNSGRGNELEMLMGQGDVSSAETEIQLLKSRTLLGNVVDSEGLVISVTPRYFPLIGGFLARRHSAPEPASPWFGLSSYAWGGERIAVSRFDASGSYLGKEFVLTVAAEGKYQLANQNGEILLVGVTGSAAQSSDGGITLFVAELVARAGTEFRLSKRSRASVITSLQERLKISEQGRRTGLLEIALEGSDREQNRKILRGLSQSYLRWSVEVRSEESEKMLGFINEQMPLMRSELDMAERALNLYRERVGTIDLTMESSNLIERITSLETEISSLRLERAELSHKLTAEHPIIQGINEKIKKLNEYLASLDGELKGVPEKELESLKLSRDVKVASELYMLLLNKSQELKVTKAGTLGNVRIVDEAISAAYPVKPKKKRIVLLSLILGLITAISIAVLRKVLNKTVDDPAVIENKLGYPIYAEIPFSELQEGMVKMAKKRLDKSHYQLLAHNHAEDPVVESLRSLRTSIQFAMMEAENNLISISGPAPEIGKSFVSANFAYLMAESNKRVLLVDCDLRKGHLNYHFGVDKSPGLSELLSGGCTLENAINKGVLSDNLDILTTGVYPPNPSELLMSTAFQNFLAEVKEQYDLVIIDTPPILAVTDAAIVGQYAATNFMLVRAERHPLRELQTAFGRFEQNGVTMKGVIFNGIQIRKGRVGKYGYGYKYYGYQYNYK